MYSIICPDEEQMRRFGNLLGTCLGDGDVVCLEGDLGAGKTFLVKAMSEALGVAPDSVTSPTFAIMNVYSGGCLSVRHFDLYRLNSVEELKDIGFDEYVGAEGVTFIEWGLLFAAELPEEFLELNIVISSAGRSIELCPRGEHYRDLCEKVEKLVNAGN